MGDGTGGGGHKVEKEEDMAWDSVGRAVGGFGGMASGRALGNDGGQGVQD